MGKMKKVQVHFLVCLMLDFKNEDKNNLHLALGGVLGARDIESIEVNMIAINRLDNEHL